MTAREFLIQGLTIGRKLESLKRVRQSLEDSATSLASSWGGGALQVVHDENKTEKKWAEYIDTAREKATEIREKEGQLLAVKLEIANRIDKMPDGTKKDLLRWRYVALADWREIEDGLCRRPISERYRKRLHKNAIALFEWTHKDFYGKM